MSPRAYRTAALALVVSLPFVGGPESIAPRVPFAFAIGPHWPPPRSLADPRLEAERRASVGWEFRTGPRRRVVDQVCLVPDLATFLEAIAAWDDRRFFPVLLDDPTLVPTFLRAFRPARVVRYPGRITPIPEGETWTRAVATVGRSWVAEHPDSSDPPPGDVPPDPTRFGPCPQAAVASSAESPTLAGAVALAAGRFQPLIRWEPGVDADDRPDRYEARRLAADLLFRVASRLGPIDALGDACDFLTLAGDWPFRYRSSEGDNAFDDLLAFAREPTRRQLYTGRLVGSPAASAYAAMCSLFLRPDSALLFNTYDESEPPWSAYGTRAAAEALAPLLRRVEQRTGNAQAGLDGWHRVFDPLNRYPLVMINSSGGPTRFSVRGGQGRTADIPPTVPTAVVLIHSFSADDPFDPDTIAGRWLASGAFAYLGAMNEPYVLAFRTPTLVASLLADRLPLGAALRQSEREMFGFPWRLVYLGDPLFRPIPTRPAEPRLTSNDLADWPSASAP